MAAAAWATGAGIKIFLSRKTAEFEGFGDVLTDGFLNFVHFLLRIQKAAGYRIIYKSVPLFFVIGDLIVCQRHAHLLLVLKHFPFFDYLLILGFCVLVRHKGVNALTNPFEFRLAD